MAELKEGRILIPEDQFRKEFMEGAHAAYQAVSVTYGPKGRNVLLERGFGRPTYTRDGCTIVEQVFFSERSKNMGTQALAEASRAANSVSGDGSSCTVVLAYFMLKNAIQAVAAGIHPMDVSDTIMQDSRIILEALEKEVIPVKDEQLKDVATVAAGDPLVGQLIAEAILYVGPDGGILTEKAPITEIEREYVDGYYLQSGFTALQAGKKELVDPYVIVSSRRLSSAADAIEILNGIMKANDLKQGQMPRVLFIGNIEDAAYQTIVNTINQGQIDAVIVKTPPMYGELGKYLLSDIALYAKCELIDENTSLKDFVRIRDGKPFSPFIGSVDKVIASKSESTIFADNETEAVQTRIAEIKDQIASEAAPSVAEKLRDRVAKLEGKIAIFKIGAANDSTKEELEYRVEDAINSTRHAYAEGIVPGGGVTLLELSKLGDTQSVPVFMAKRELSEKEFIKLKNSTNTILDTASDITMMTSDHIATISSITRDALRSTFQQLLINANLPAELKLDQALSAKKGFGYNLRKDDKLVDVVKEGVIDPVVVVREALTHAFGMAAETIKVGLGLVFEDTKK